MNIIGVDEAGRGPVLGPLVVCAVQLPQTDLNLLIEYGVNDSKQHSPHQRSKIVEWFEGQAKQRNWQSALVVLEASVIDEWLQGSGMNALGVHGFQQAIQALTVGDSCTLFLDACDVNAERFGQEVKQGLVDSTMLSVVSEHKADANYPIVSMASILAKHHRDCIIQSLAEELSVEIGSGYPSDPTTRQALHQLIQPTFIHDSVRRNWATAKNFWESTYGGHIPQRHEPLSHQHGLFDFD